MATANSIHSDLAGSGNDHGLFHAFSFMNQRHLSVQSTEGNFYHHLDEALRHILEAHILALWLHVSKKEKLSNLRGLSAKEIYTFAEQILNNFASNLALEKHDNFESSLDEDQHNDTLRKMIIMTHDLLYYYLLKSRIKLGDVGIMRLFLPSMFFRFLGGGNTNYTEEWLEMIQGFEREWPDDLMSAFAKYSL
jgi:hypothetical protein